MANISRKAPIPAKAEKRTVVEMPFPPEHAQGHQLGCNGGTDVRSVNDGGGLCQRHDAQIHKPDDHHRDCTRTLDGRSAQRAYAHTGPSAFTHTGKQFLQFFAPCIFKICAHQMASHQKDAYTCNQGKNG
ncbi:MAG: hypothetical protein J6X35_06145 [Bacteroidales bacterium]|nr:hypothetical protein [Bacteroidales bacterium]